LSYSRHYKTRISQEGQSAVEMLIALPLILILIFGIIQWGLISRTKVTLNAATELAARSGALNYGSRSAITNGFASGMMPLFLHGDDSDSKLNLSGTTMAKLRSTFAVNKQASLTILNPSSAIWNKYKENVKYPRIGRSETEIVNDNLMYRPSSPRNINGLKMNLQDANLLKIRMDWCEELVVPIIGQMIKDTASGFFDGALFAPSAQQVKCNLVGRITGKPMLAMQSEATYRMQTPFRNK
jgi:hypothetical protein